MWLEMSGLILRLPAWRRPFARTTTSGYCVLLFPDSTEGRWFDRLPTPGTRLRSEGGHGYWAETYVVDEVLQSGRNTYTVYPRRSPPTPQEPQGTL